MNIFIEGTPLIKERSGVGQYIKRLAEAMIRLDETDNFTVFRFGFWGRPLPKSVFEPGISIKRRFIRFLPGRVYNLLFKYRLAPPVDLLLGARPDIFWFPNFVCWPVLSRHSKRLVTIYDLSFIHYPQFTSPANLRYMLRFVPRSIKVADKILTISENARQEIADYYKIDPANIDVVYPAVDTSVFQPSPQAEVDRVVKKYDLPKDFILFTGTLEPRKNVEGLLRAYARLNQDLRQQYSLVLAGGKGWLDEPIIKLMHELQQQGEKIISLGYVPDEDLPAVYSAAHLFVYPSFYEGFGMPPLEAMACGTPVIASDNSSLPEVVGKAGIMVNADDTKGLSEQMERALTDKMLASRLKKAGLSQAAKFSWEKSATTMLAVIKGLQ